jgi:hypothetical protein
MNKEKIISEIKRSVLTSADNAHKKPDMQVAGETMV